MVINSSSEKRFTAAFDPDNRYASTAEQTQKTRCMRHIDRATPMDISTSITFRGMTASEALRARIEERVQRLNQFAEDILACNVVVNACEHKHHHGNRYNVRASVALRDCTIEAGHTPSPDSSHGDAYLAVTHTFDALRRRVEDHVRCRRGDIKSHAVNQ
jgi:ribosomal subunit interface protein